MRICWIIKQLSCSILRNIPWFSQLGLRPRRLSIRWYSSRFRRIIVKYNTVIQYLTNANNTWQFYITSLHWHLRSPWHLHYITPYSYFISCVLSFAILGSQYFARLYFRDFKKTKWKKRAFNFQSVRTKLYSYTFMFLFIIWITVSIFIYLCSYHWCKSLISVWIIPL